MRKTLKGAALAAFALTCVSNANAGSEQYIGDVVLTGSGFCPNGSLPAEGQQMAINSNQPLFSLLGVTYGGDGRINFNLPDLRGRIPMGRGQAEGSANTYVQGTAVGTETMALAPIDLYVHNHALQSSNNNTDTGDSTDAMLGDLSALPSAAHFYHAGSVTPDQTLNANALSMTGQSEPFENRQPIIAMRWCIYVVGTYPPRP